MRRPLRVTAAALAILALVVAFALSPAGRSYLGLGACRLDTPDAGRASLVVLRRLALDGAGAIAVGSRYSAALGLPVAFRWDGADWVEMPVPVASESETTGLHDVAVLGGERPSGGDAWAVGSTRASTPFAVAWDGFAWSPVVTEGLEGAVAEWLGVGASPEAGVWSVGKRTTDATDRAIVGRLDRDAFFASDLPAVGARGDVLVDVDLAGDGGWAVGWSVAEGGARSALAARLEGGAWRVVPTPEAGDAVLSAVAVVSETSAYAVGWSLDALGEPSPLVLAWDGEAWRVAAGPRAGGRLLAVAARGPVGDLPARLVVAGEATASDGRAEGFVAALEDAEWTDLSLSQPRERWLTGVALGPDGAVLGVGSAIGEAERYGSFLARGCAP